MWTDERVETLKDLWSKGYTGGEIRMRIGFDVTRSALMGKVRRLGLPFRAVNNRTATPKKRQQLPKRAAGNSQRIITKPLPPSPIKDPTPVLNQGPLPGAKLIGLMDLRDDRTECRFPHEIDGKTVFCGCSTVPGTSWCPSHLQSVSGAVPVSK